MKKRIYDGVLRVLVVPTPLREIVLELVQLRQEGCREGWRDERVGFPDPLEARHFAAGDEYRM